MNDFTIDSNAFDVAFSMNVEVDFVEIILSKIITSET